MKKLFLITISILIFSFVFNCADEENAGEAANNNSASINSADSNTNSEAPVQTPKPTPKPTPKLTASGQENPISLDPVRSENPSPDTTQNQVTSDPSVFAVNPAGRVNAKDFQIGPLQDAYSDSREYLNAYRVVSTFFFLLMNKEVKETSFLSSVFKPFEISLKHPITQGYLPDTVRLGKATFISSDEVRINVRMYKGEGASIGEVYLTKEESEWKISDLQLGFVLLREKYTKSRKPYVPSQYDFLLEN